MRFRSTRSSHSQISLRDFEGFYHQHAAPLIRFVARRVRPSVVDEVVAATFAIAWKKFDLVANPSLPWLYRIATFEILHDYRRQSREGEQIPLADIELTDDFPLDDALSITGAFAQLSQSDQELLRLLYWDDLRRDEIAVVLGCSMGTLNVRVHRAMERLRAFLVETSSLSDHADKPHHVPEEE